MFREVFARGEYGYTHKLNSMYAAARRPLPELPPEPVAHSIDEARENGAECGTCSVLDLYGIDTEPGPGVAGPISRDVVSEHMGTDHPTLAQVEGMLPELYGALERGAAAYVVCYVDGRPSHHVFLGMSFD